MLLYEKDDQIKLMKNENIEQYVYVKNQCLSVCSLCVHLTVTQVVGRFDEGHGKSINTNTFNLRVSK